MREKKKLLIVLCLALALVFSFTACGDDEKEENKDSDKKVEKFSGELTNAMADKIVVKGDDDLIEFVTNKDTVYDLGNAVELTVGDMIDVDYHEDGSDKIAEKVKITKEKVSVLHFKGTLTDVNNDDITVDGKTLTAHFLMDNKTKVKGRLRSGDEIKVTYTGDIAKHPYANKIEVTKEKKVPKKYTLNGNVSELENGTVLVSIQSAKAYRFKILKKTKITGKDTSLKVGYDVEVTYTGDVDRVPGAIKIEVTDTSDSKVKKITGTIESVSDGSFILKTKTSSYSFSRDSSTKYTGEKMKKGRIATVSYVGKLGNDEKAIGVYTIIPRKDANDKKHKKAPKKHKKEPMPDPKPTPKPEPGKSIGPEPVVDPTITAKGEIISVSKKAVRIQDIHDNEIKLKITKKTKIASGYVPEKGDEVQVVYDKDKMTLLKIQLIERPVDPGDDPDDPDGDIGNNAEPSDDQQDNQDEGAEE